MYCGGHCSIVCTSTECSDALKTHVVPLPLCRLNAAEMFIDVGKTERETATNWVAESGVLDLFLLLGPSPHQVTPSVLGLTTVSSGTF